MIKNVIEAGGYLLDIGGSLQKDKNAAGVYLSEAQNPMSPLHTVYLYTVYLFTQGRGGEEEKELNQSEGYSAATVHKAGSKKPT